jgi:hypothetical protein
MTSGSRGEPRRLGCEEGMCSGFVSQVASHSEEFMIEKDIESVFPLFSPEGERLWAPGWEYTNLMSSKDLQSDYVFLTDSHDHRSTTAIWIVSDYDPVKHYVSYYKVEPGEKIGKIVIQCFEQNQKYTLVKVTYKYIGLSDSGNQFIRGFTEEHYKAFIDGWGSLIHAYFERPLR